MVENYWELFEIKIFCIVFLEKSLRLVWKVGVGMATIRIERRISLIFKVFGYGLAGVGIAADVYIIASEVKNLTNSELASYLEQLADDIDEKVQLMDFLQVACAFETQ